MPQLDGFPGVSGATDFGELRKLLSGLIVRSADGTARAGVLRDPSVPLVTGRADLKVDVATFPFATARNGGVILGMNEGTTQVAISALPTANKRIDILWARQNIAELGDASDLPTFGWTTGVADATPVPPTTPLPAGALEIARMEVAVGTTATNDAAKVTLTQTAAHTATVGGVVPFRSESALLAWSAANSTRAIALDTGNEFIRLNGAWVGGLVDLSTLTLASGVALTQGGGYILLRDSTIEYNVRLSRAAKLVGSGSETLFTVPPALRPTNSEPVAVHVLSGVGRGFGWGFIDANGLLTVAAPFMDSTSVAGAVTIVVKSTYKR